MALLLAASDPPLSLARVLTDADQTSAARTWANAKQKIWSVVKDPASRAYLTLAIEKNLDAKEALNLQLTPREVERTVVGYELFKFDTYLASGVFPKRYFGYFDRRADTASYETTLIATIRGATGLINELQKARGSKTRVNDAEIAVTFIAEGGAILLRERQDQLQAIHPVFGVGLDDIATGFAAYPGLIEAFDARFSTHLADIIVRDPQPRLARMMTFEEAILGTAVMWLYEKELAAQKLRARSANKEELGDRSLADQFIIGSLVYNSGILFPEARIEMIEHFTSGAYLAKVSRTNAKSRWPLPLFEPQDARARLLEEDYPVQETSWSAVYHVLQRYGAWVALMRFTDLFDQRGAFR